VGESTTIHTSNSNQDPLRRAFDAHYERLVRLAFLLSRNQDDAEDIVQEAFVRSARRLASLSEVEWGSYLRKAVVNQWKSTLRRLRVRTAKDLRVWSTAEAGIQPEPDRQTFLWHLVMKLPPRQRATIVLRYYEDLSEAETARILGCSIGTVKSQRSRAIETLRRRYQNED
jgi:RNA polymerase sigma-70 factor (sigma-E family)